MADINQVITLGIGTPADIEHFILVGLNVNVVEISGISVNLYERDIDLDLYERSSFGLTLSERPDG